MKCARKLVDRLIEANDIDIDKIYPFQIILTAIFCVIFILSTYLLNPFMEMWMAILILTAEVIYNFYSAPRKFPSNDKFSYDFFSNFPMSLLILFCALSLLNYDYFTRDYNLPFDQLKQADGYIKPYHNTDNILKSYYLFKDKDLKTPFDGYKSNFNFNYPEHRLMDRKVHIPTDDPVKIIYMEIEDGKDSSINLIFEAKSGTETYVKYDESLAYYTHMHKKSILYLALNMIIYLTTIIIGFYLLFKNPYLKRSVNPQ